MMAKVTGLGCSASAIIGAFVAVISNTTEAVTAAAAVFSIAGQIAAKNVNGPGSLQVAILDKLYSLNKTEFLEYLNINIKN